MARHRENFRRPPNPKTKAEHDGWIRAAERGGPSYEDYLPSAILWELKLGEILHLASAKTVIVRRGHSVQVQSTVIRGHYGPPTPTPAQRAKHARNLTPAARRRKRPCTRITSPGRRRSTGRALSARRRGGSPRRRLRAQRRERSRAPSEYRSRGRVSLTPVALRGQIRESMTDEERKGKVAAIQAEVDKVAAFDLNALDSPLHGSLNFNALKPTITFLQTTLKDLGAVALFLPQDAIGTIFGRLNSFNSNLARIAAFRPVPDSHQPGTPPFDARAVHQTLFDGFYGELKYVLNDLWIPALQSQLIADRHAAKRIDPLRVIAFYNLNQDKLNVQLATSEKLIADLQDAAAKKGASTYVDTFEKAGGQYRRAADKWLYATIAMAVATVGFGLALLRMEVPSTESLGQILTYFTGRVIILTALFYFTGLAGRNYRANKHNDVVNQHRAVALRTFTLFTDGASDADTKSAILLKAAESIFQASGTGYQSKDAEPAPNSTIVEILRSGSKKE
jgi:hypothetical protein